MNSIIQPLHTVIYWSDTKPNLSPLGNCGLEVFDGWNRSLEYYTHQSNNGLSDLSLSTITAAARINKLSHTRGLKTIYLGPTEYENNVNNDNWNSRITSQMDAN